MMSTARLDAGGKTVAEAFDGVRGDEQLTGEEEGVMRVARRVLLRLEQRVKVPEAAGARNRLGQATVHSLLID